MPIKRYKAEQIVTMLRRIEVSIANGKPTPQACKEAEITVQTFYRTAARNAGDDAVTTIHRRTSVRLAEVPHLRTPTFPAPRGVRGAQAEISLATMVYNLKRMLNVLGATQLQQALAR